MVHNDPEDFSLESRSLSNVGTGWISVDNQINHRRILQGGHHLFWILEFWDESRDYTHLKMTIFERAALLVCGASRVFWNPDFNLVIFEEYFNFLSLTNFFDNVFDYFQKLFYVLTQRALCYRNTYVPSILFRKKTPSYTFFHSKFRLSCWDHFEWKK